MGLDFMTNLDYNMQADNLKCKQPEQNVEKSRSLVERARLEIVYTPQGYRGFESLLLRHTKPCNLNGYRVLSCPLTLILTLYRFQRAFAAIVSTGDFLNKFLHAVSGLLPHFLRYMTIHIQGKAGGGMAQIGLHCLDVIAALNGGHSKAVP